METRKPPFYFEVIDNFLPEDEVHEIVNLHSALDYKRLECDLYKFMQSSELAEEENFGFFRRRLDNIFGEKTANDADVGILNEATYYTFFASNYLKGDFLLCHDDMIDERLYAFTFYIEDFSSGSLIIYENDCQTVHNEIAIKANRLVIFKVSEKSFHEVSLCREDGRKAISGWLNRKGHINVASQVDESHTIREDTELFDFDISSLGFLYGPDSALELEFTDITDVEESRSIQGPFTNRRVFQVFQGVLYAPRIPGYELLSTESLFLDDDSYILLNDKVNTEVEEVLDVFIFREEKHPVNLLHFVNSDNQADVVLDANDGHMLIVSRFGRQLYIPRIPKEIYLKHFIYKRI
ncbi:Prolyl 3-hydroxylase ogfod1 [Glugoides intestinalis]